MLRTSASTLILALVATGSSRCPGRDSCNPSDEAARKAPAVMGSQDSSETSGNVQSEPMLLADTAGLRIVEDIPGRGIPPEERTHTSEGPPRHMPVDVHPVCTYRPNPRYPSVAREAGIEGTVVLWVWVDTNGMAGDVAIYGSSGASILDEAAVAVAWNTRWNPAQLDSLTVGAWTTMQYTFELD